MPLELLEGFGQRDGVPANRHRTIVASVFAFLADAPAQPPCRGVEEQQGFQHALQSVPQPVHARDVRQFVGEQRFHLLARQLHQQRQRQPDHRTQQPRGERADHVVRQAHRHAAGDAHRGAQGVETLLPFRGQRGALLAIQRRQHPPAAEASQQHHAHAAQPQQREHGRDRVRLLHELAGGGIEFGRRQRGQPAAGLRGRGFAQQAHDGGDRHQHHRGQDAHRHGVAGGGIALRQRGQRDRRDQRQQRALPQRMQQRRRQYRRDLPRQQRDHVHQRFRFALACAMSFEIWSSSSRLAVSSSSARCTSVIADPANARRTRSLTSERCTTGSASTAR